MQVGKGSRELLLGVVNLNTVVNLNMSILD